MSKGLYSTLPRDTYTPNQMAMLSEYAADAKPYIGDDCVPYDYIVFKTSEGTYEYTYDEDQKVYVLM
ncbi:MAG: hypothetical protein AB7E76_02715 [Deferribacterales bacterium]